MNDILSLEGKVALVVGGGFGMGAASALGLARAGCHVDRRHQQRACDARGAQWILGVGSREEGSGKGGKG